MIVKFKYLGLQNDKIENEVEKVEIENNADIQKLIINIKKIYELSDEFFKGCSFMINNRRADLDAKIEDGDYVLIMKALGGG